MIELTQLVGQRRKLDGELETIKQPTDRVMRDGTQVGWLARQDAALFCPIVELSDSEIAPILRGCQSLRDKAGEFVGAVSCRGRVPNQQAVAEAIAEQGETSEQEDE